MDVDWIARGLAGASLLIAIVGTSLKVGAMFRSLTRQRPKLTGTIANCLLTYGLGERADYLSIEISISNLSDTPNSVVEYGLVLGPPYNTSTRPINYRETTLGETILEHSPGSDIRPEPLALKGMQLEFLSNPVNLPAHETRIGWVGFPLPSVPAEVAKGIPMVLWAIAVEGEPLVLGVDLTEFVFERIPGGLPGEQAVVDFGAVPTPE